MDTPNEVPADKSSATDEPKRLLDLSMFDTKAASEAGIVVELDELPLDDAGKPYSITILGMDAEKIVEKDQKTLDRYIKLIRKNRDPGDTKAGEQENIDKLAEATIAWHLPPVDGAPLPTPTKPIALKLYSDPRFRWIVRKLTKRQGDESGFFVKSSTS